MRRRLVHALLAAPPCWAPLRGSGPAQPLIGASTIPRSLETGLRDHAFMEKHWSTPQFFAYARSTRLGIGGGACHDRNRGSWSHCHAW